MKRQGREKPFTSPSEAATLFGYSSALLLPSSILPYLKQKSQEQFSTGYLLNCVPVHFSCHINAIELLHGSYS